MSKIFIHLGAHKTASSFIQANLRANTEAFEKQGWRAIDFQTEFKKARAAVVKQRGNKHLKERGNEQLHSFLDEVRKDSRNVFLSYEGFLGTMNMRGGELYANHAKQMAMLKESFAGRDMQVGFCVRNFADQAESSYSFSVAKGWTEQRFAKYANKISPDKISWLKIVQNLSDTFGPENLVVWTYEDFKKDGAAAFLKIVGAAGVDAAEITPTVTAPLNVSLTVEQVRLLRVWHKALRSHLNPSPANARILKRKLRAFLTELPRDSDSKGRFKPKKRKKLTEHYERELTVIRERWGDRMLNFTQDAMAPGRPTGIGTQTSI